VPPLSLCTDNAAMIAAAAFYRFADGRQDSWDLDVVPGLRLA
jgi:N6-L-threonylcarbamoyladenine synthase